MWPDDAKLILRKSTKFQTIHSSIVSSQHEDERTGKKFVLFTLENIKISCEINVKTPNCLTFPLNFHVLQTLTPLAALFLEENLVG